MVKVLDEGADLTGYEVKQCTASGAIHGSRMVEVIRGKKKLAVQVADCPLKPLEKRDEEDWGHYADWYTKYVKRSEYLLPSMATRSALTCTNSTETSYLVFKGRGQSNRIGLLQIRRFVRGRPRDPCRKTYADRRFMSIVRARTLRVNTRNDGKAPAQ